MNHTTMMNLKRRNYTAQNFNTYKSKQYAGLYYGDNSIPE